jgi:competence protein ComEC
MPLLWLSLTFIIGVTLAPYCGGSVLLWAGIALTLIVLDILSRKTPGWQVRFNHLKKYTRVSIFLLLAALCLGVFRARQATPFFDEQSLAYYNGTERMQLQGTLVRPPDVLDQAIQLDVAVDEIVQLYDVEIHLPVQGRVLLRIQPGQTLHYGDRIIFSGSLQTPSENPDFSYRDYLSVKGIYSTMYYAQIDEVTPASGFSIMGSLYAFRDNAYQTINAMLPQPEAGLLSGILLGMERDIPESIEQDFQDTGTSHIVAISGFNIALVAGLLTLLLDKMIGKKLAPLGVIGGIFLYTLLVGAQAAVVRAAIMGSLCLLGRQIGRRSSGLNTLCITAAIMVALNPLILADVGFQLSFAATLGLVLFAGSWQSALTHLITNRFSEAAAEKLSAPISEYFLFTLAAQLTTLPLILYHFGRFSISSFITNPLILPAQPLIMMLGGPLVFLGMICLPLGKALIWLVWPLLYYTIHIVALAARIPGGVIPVETSLVISTVVVIFLLMMLWLLRERFPQLALWMRPGILFLALILANGFLWREIYRRPDGQMSITVYPQEDCTVLLLETPAGSRMLVNAGNEASALNTWLGESLPVFSRQIDLLLIPQDRSACYTAVPKLMERFQVQHMIYPPVMAPSTALANVKTVSSSQGLDIEASSQPVIVTVDGMQMLLHPSQNGSSLVQELHWQNFSALLVWDGNVPCNELSQQGGLYTLYVDARKSPRSLAQECPGLSAQIQAAALPPGEMADFNVDMAVYEKLTIHTDGEQVWLNGELP